MAITVFASVITVPAQAQIQIPNGNYLSKHYYTFIPKKFSYTGQPQLYFEDEDESGIAIRIYDESLKLKKELACDNLYHSYRTVTEERSVIPGEYDDVVVNEESQSVGSLEEAISMANNYGAESHTKKDNVHTFLPVELPEGNGFYWKLVYTEGAAEILIYGIQRFPRYSDDWQVTDEEEMKVGYAGFSSVAQHNLDEDIPIEDISLTFSQTLFNTDDKYEYLAPVYESAKEPYIRVIDRIWRNNEEFPIKRELIYDGNITSTNVVSENGSVLYTFSGDVISITIMGGKTYAVAEEYLSDGRCVLTFYEINPQQNSIKAVQTSEVKISRRSDNVTIETSGAAAGQSREVVVTSMDGRTVARCGIPAGETTTRISTARLAGGVYNFTVYAAGKKLENGKIVIR